MLLAGSSSKTKHGAASHSQVTDHTTCCCLLPFVPVPHPAERTHSHSSRMRQYLPSPFHELYYTTNTQIASIMRIIPKVLVGLFLLILQPSISFQTHCELRGSTARIRHNRKRTHVETLLHSSATDDASPGIRLDPDAIKLKNELIALAAATLRGVSI